MEPTPFSEQYETLMGSDVERGGMYLELRDRASDALALWAFYSDDDASIEFERYHDVPTQVEVWFQQEARRRLPPISE
jgi:hypothetical protein